jgi:hypothetical protein
VVDVELEEPRAGVDFEDLRLGAVGAVPQHALSHAGVDLPRGDVLLVHVNDLTHAAIVRRCETQIRI